MERNDFKMEMANQEFLELMWKLGILSKALARHINLFQFLDDEERKKPVYSKSDLIEILRSKTATKLLNWAIKHKIIKPKKGKNQFSAYDETVLRILIYKDNPSVQQSGFIPGTVYPRKERV